MKRIVIMCFGIARLYDDFLCTGVQAGRFGRFKL